VTAGALSRPRRAGVRRARRSTVLRPLVVFTIAVVVAFFAMIYTRISLDRSAFALHQIEEQIATEERVHWDLRLELARLQDPQRINNAAAALGLVYPTERITVEAPGVVGDTVDGVERWTAARTLLSEP
jgi:cell division protein FtsL